jgi:DNA-binding response OmpR family regulator
MPFRAAKLRALVADPAPYMADLVGQMLRTLGIRDIDTVSTLASAESALATAKYDLVMIDGRLGDDGGLKVVSDLRTKPEHRNHDAPIIMMCAAPSAAQIAAARDAGINEFLRKPFSAQHIKLRVDAIRNTSRAFLETDSYTGPDRRRRERPVTADRRNGRADVA